MGKKVLIKTLLTTSTVGLLGGGIASSLTLTSCSKKSEKTLVIELDEGSKITTNQGVELSIQGTYDASDFDGPITIAPESREAFTFRGTSGNTFDAELNADASIGPHDLRLMAIDGTNSVTYSNKITFEVVSPSEKTLEISIPILPLTTEGVALSFTGYYQALNFGDSPIEIDLAPDSKDAFELDEISYENDTFRATLKSSASIGPHILQLVANDNIFSAPFIFTVGSYATSNGSNWSEHTSGSVQMELKEDMTATITSIYSYVAEDLVIPEYVFDNGKIYKVTSIGNGVFWGCSGLTGSLTIPNSVTSIGDRAFANCSRLTGSLTIPDTVTSIGTSAFFGCNGLTGSLTIGSTVNIIGDQAFCGCTGLSGSLNIPDSVISIGARAFSNCENLSSLTIGNNVISIGERAFQQCYNISGSLTIPNRVTTIGDWAFTECYGLNGTLTIGSNVVNIETDAFDKCSNINNIVISEENEKYGLATNVGAAQIVVEKGGDGTFKKNYDASASQDIVGALAIGHLEIPSDGSVTRIGNSAFVDCIRLTGELVIPNNVTAIGNDAFAGCSGFTGDLIIPNTVTSIGNRAFFECSGFTGSLTIYGVTDTMGGSAFYECNGFNHINLLDFSSQPGWTNNGYFTGWSENGTVSVTGNWSSNMMNVMVFLWAKGLPTGWTYTA